MRFYARLLKTQAVVSAGVLVKIDEKSEAIPGKAFEIPPVV
jgi:hypothetical protein